MYAESDEALLRRLRTSFGYPNPADIERLRRLDLQGALNRFARRMRVAAKEREPAAG